MGHVQELRQSAAHMAREKRLSYAVLIGGVVTFFLTYDV